jgi:2,4-dichlorophenol 6-monooxygenase
MKEVNVPVLIVGGAGCRPQRCRSFLARQGIESWLVERHPKTSPAPKAHYLNLRTMEILREEGIADAVLCQRSTPADANMSTRRLVHLARRRWRTRPQDHPCDGRLRRRRAPKASLRKASSPCRTANYAQLHLEPLLLAHAKTLKHASLNYSHELQSFSQDADGVVAAIKDLIKDTVYTVRAQYMIGADGGRTIGPAWAFRWMASIACSTWSPATSRPICPTSSTTTAR